MAFLKKAKFTQLTFLCIMMSSVMLTLKSMSSFVNLTAKDMLNPTSTLGTTKAQNKLRPFAISTATALISLSQTGNRGLKLYLMVTIETLKCANENF